MKLKIHHFFDIIRDFGSGKEIAAHPHGHWYHKIAVEIRTNPELELELVVAADEICAPCSHLIAGVCDDIITHRNDFKGKEDFNNHLDKRIMEVCNFEVDLKYSPRRLCENAKNYLSNIVFIYEGNDLKHTELRKQNVLAGLKYYSEKHGFSLNF